MHIFPKIGFKKKIINLGLLVIIFNVISEKCLEILGPKKCVSCGKYGDFLCFNCSKQIEFIKTPTCAGCGAITKKSVICPKCKSKKSNYLDGLIVCTRYMRGPIKSLIYSLKYEGFLEISEILSQIIFERIKAEKMLESTLLAYVPLHKRKEKVRGFNQSLLIAENLAKDLNTSCHHLLIRVKHDQAQAKKNRRLRLSSIKDCFVVSKTGAKKIHGQVVYIIDDVSTTGATLNECARMLKLSGAKKVIGLVVAKNI